ncbi:MAG: hypothetical protein ACYC1I_12745 [Acidimicrobiales bacterium]
MDMNICDHGPSCRTASCPDGTETPTIKLDDAVIKTVRVHIIVEQEGADLPTVGSRDAQQKRTALLAASRPPTELGNATAPNRSRADKSGSTSANRSKGA